MWATLAIELTTQPDQLAALRAIAVPTLVVVGDQDRPFMQPSRDLASAVPGARLVVVPDAGHSPHPRTRTRGALHSSTSSPRSDAGYSPVAFSMKRSRSTITRDATRGNEAVAVVHRHPEGEPSPLDRLERGLGAHLPAHRRRQRWSSWTR